MPEESQDVALRPGANADSQAEIERHIAEGVLAKYDVYSYRHAAGILKNSFPDELGDLENALRTFSLTKEDIALPGGNESVIPKKISRILRPLKWNEVRIQGDLVIRVHEQSEELKDDGKLQKHTLPKRDDIKIENYIDGHKIDYVKGRVAFDMEWNSKDQTFDRDLYAFRMFHECGVISVAAIITRSEKLNPIFETLPKLKKDGTVDTNTDGTTKYCREKYGASTTWMGKLLYRLNAGRHGGCPVLVIGIKPNVIEDLETAE